MVGCDIAIVVHAIRRQSRHKRSGSSRLSRVRCKEQNQLAEGFGGDVVQYDFRPSKLIFGPKK